MKRLQTIGLVVTVLAVLILAGSLVSGLGRDGEAETPDQATAPEPDEPSERIRIEVLNAAGVPGLARTATQRLRRERRFDVVYFGNAGAAERDSSVVIARTGDPEAAQRVADALGISRVRSEVDAGLHLEVTVILGRDWQEYAPELLPGLKLPREDSL